MYGLARGMNREWGEGVVGYLFKREDWMIDAMLCKLYSY